jgi:deazaflavin-dependent oxidoreductase (nitroreductase family)
MAYLRPPLFARKVFNPMAMRLGISGSTALVLRRRRTGDEQRIPVIPVEHDGAQYLVSTRGESDWVKNLRAAGEGELHRRGQATRFRATEIPATERPPVLTAYRERNGKMVDTYFNRLPEPSDHPVFRIETV